MKVVINNDFGGFSLSYEAVMEYAKLKGIKLYAYSENFRTKEITPVEANTRELFIHYVTKPCKNAEELNECYFSTSDLKRDDPILIAVVKKLKKKANGSSASLKVIEIPNDAFIIAGGGEQIRCDSHQIEQKRRNNRCLQLNRNGFSPSIRRKRHKIQPMDIAKINGTNYVVKAMFNKGSYVRVTSKDGKILNFKTDLINSYFNRGTWIWN